MTRTQKSPLLAASRKLKIRKRKTKSNTVESDIESESAKSISARLSVDTLNSDQKLIDFNSFCVKIETDEWFNTAADFYSAFAKSEQVPGGEMHPDCNKQDCFNLVLEQTGCLQSEKDYTKQDCFTSECVKSEQTECEVMHPDVTRQACVNYVRVNKNTTDNSNVYTEQDELHSEFGKTKQSLNLNTDQSYLTTNDLNYVCCIAKQYIISDVENGNTTANNHNALCDHTYSKTPDNQAKLADPNSVFLTREEIDLSNVDQYCARPTVVGETITIDHYSNPNVPRHSNSEKDDSENVVTMKPAKMKLNKTGDQVNTVKRMKKAKTPEKDKIEYSLQERNLASCLNLEPPDDDHFLYCGECNKEFEGDCPVHGPYNYILDKEVPEGDPLQADHTLPDCLEIKTSKKAGSGLGVFSKKGLESRIMFGPYVGDIITDHHKSGYCWQVKTYKDRQASYFVDAQNKATPNWMRYVNCAMTQTDRNLVALKYKEGIYYCTLKPVSLGEELMVWYGDEFAGEFGPIIDKNLCSYSTKNSGNLKTHMMIHTEERLYKCEECDYACNRSCDLKKHMRIHTEERLYKCEVCGKAFKHICNLKIHMMIHTGERPYKCEVCGKAFNQSCNLMKHKMTHTAERLYKCAVCGYPCIRSCDLKKHMRIHTEDRRYKCEECGKAFNQSRDLKTHMRIHTGERLYKCEVCGKGFNQSSNLKTHMMIHTGERLYKCEVCGKAFNQSRYLKKHMRIHKGERPYKCEVCGKAFNQSRYLQKHMRIHTGGGLYKCEVCGKAFEKSGYLKLHMGIHTGERPYKCEVCGYSLKHSGHLKTHMMIHTGERPYKCKVCGYAYKQIGPWKRHMKMHKGETVQDT